MFSFLQGHLALKSAVGCEVGLGSPADRPVLNGEVEHGPVDAAGQDAADVQQRRKAESWRPRRLLRRLREPHAIITGMACGREDRGRAWLVAAQQSGITDSSWETG